MGVGLDLCIWIWYRRNRDEILPATRRRDAAAGVVWLTGLRRRRGRGGLGRDGGFGDVWSWVSIFLSSNFF